MQEGRDLSSMIEKVKVAAKYTRYDVRMYDTSKIGF
jgi:hypothetical protein